MKRAAVYNISLLFLAIAGFGQDMKLQLVKTITGGITPKSVIFTPKGMYAQNMMYSHSITVYDYEGELLHTISDSVSAGLLGDTTLSGNYQGAPVEAAYTPDSNFVWVSNYQMYGKNFMNPGEDACGIDNSLDKSFLYKINTETQEIVGTVKVGSVPKYLAISPNGKHLLVSNWCNGSVTIIDLATEKIIKEITVGRYPRGIAIGNDSHYAYVAVMGEKHISRIDLHTFETEKWSDIGAGPRHICIDDKKGVLYVSLNKESVIAKVDLYQKKTVKKAYSGITPRSMVLSRDKKYLYVVNYNSGTVSRLDAHDLTLLQSVKTNVHPIGIAYDKVNDKIWVACYSGSIQIFEMKEVEITLSPKEKLVENKKVITLPEDKKPEKILPIVVSYETVVPTKTHYYSIIGVYGDVKNVEKMLAKCKAMGYSPKALAYRPGLTAVACAETETRDEIDKIEAKAVEDFGGAWILKK